MQGGPERIGRHDRARCSSKQGRRLLRGRHAVAPLSALLVAPGRAMQVDRARRGGADRRGLGVRIPLSACMHSALLDGATARELQRGTTELRGGRPDTAHAGAQNRFAASPSPKPPQLRTVGGPAAEEFTAERPRADCGRGGRGGCP